MNREIKFRGRMRNAPCQIVVGHYRYDEKTEKHLIGHWFKPSTNKESWRWFEDVVFPKSVGQYTGLKDKNGIEIYEGDIYTGSGPDKYVNFSEDLSAWIGVNINRSSSWTYLNGGFIKYVEVIGNIHDNPELLKKPQQLVTNDTQTGTDQE